MIRILLDQGIPRSAVTSLRENGFDVVHVAEIGMSTAYDIAIIDYARKEQRGIITLDADFHALLAVSKANNPSVLRVRKEGLHGVELADLVKNVLELVAKDWNSGALVTTNGTTVRLHHLQVLFNNSK